MEGLKRAVLGALGMLEKKARAGDILDRAGNKEGRDELYREVGALALSRRAEIDTRAYNIQR